MFIQSQQFKITSLHIFYTIPVTTLVQQQSFNAFWLQSGDSHTNKLSAQCSLIVTLCRHQNTLPNIKSI